MKNFIALILILFTCVSCSKTSSLQVQETSRQGRFLLILPGENPVYLDRSSIRINPNNANELVYYTITNINSSDPDTKGTSMKNLMSLNCAQKISVLNVDERLEIYTQFFAKGEKLLDIPEKATRTDMKDEISPLSRMSAAVCQDAGKAFGNNPNALNEMHERLAKQKNKIK